LETVCLINIFGTINFFCKGQYKQMKRVLLILMAILLSASTPDSGYRSDVYQGYVSNRMELWKNALDRMNESGNKTTELIAELLNYQYGYIGYCLGFNMKEEGKKYFELAQKNLDILEKDGYDLSAIHAYKSAFYGFRISLNKITAPVNGKKSIYDAKMAIKLNSENWLGYIQLGNTEFYRPSAIGGSKKRALGYYLKAKELLEQVPGNTSENWNYLQLMVVLGQTYTYLHDYPNAEAVYKNILKMEPGFVYVRDELYPAFLKKMEAATNP